MECLYGQQCGRTCKLSRDPSNKIVFADKDCQRRYYLTRQAVADATAFNAGLFDELWFIHVALTRHVILGAVHDAPNTPWRIEQLLGNQADLGRMLGLAVGDTAFGQAAQKLLETHIVQAKGLLEALMDANSSELKLDQLFIAWNDNGREIVGALGSRLLTKRQVKEAYALGDLMLTHLSLTYSEMKRTVRGETKKSLEVYREIQRCAAEMSHAIDGAIAAL